MDSSLIVVVPVALVAGFALAWRLAQRSSLNAQQEELATAVDLALDVLRHERSETLQAALDTALSAASSQLGSQLQAGREVLDRERHTVSDQVERVQSELGRVAGLVAELQKERAQQTGALASRLEQAHRVTSSLAETTRSLQQALASPQARGQWGERIAEDVLRAAGFVEHISYRKQTKLAGGSVPDYTFLLPKGHVVHMDVKFPIDNYLRWLEADDDPTRARLARDFQRDVRQRIREIGDRAYIDPQTTVDYVLLFVPNESVYGFCHEHDPEVIDYALGFKVVLCSPTTLFAVLAVIRQAVDNFLVERRSAEILGAVTALREQWERMAEPIDKMRRGLDSAQRAFHDLSGPRFHQFTRQLEKLETVRDQRLAALDADADPPTVDRDSGTSTSTDTVANTGGSLGGDRYPGPMGRFYITTPIYYVNDAPHIGHAYTTVNADAVARWHRLIGDDTIFLTGTDEHGLKVQRAAEANGRSPLAQADETSQRFSDAWADLDIAYDQFIRTTEPRHHRATQELLDRVRDNGYIYKGSYAGWYCVGCEAYYTADDLGEGNTCPLHERPVEWFEEDNYFFKLSAFENQLTDWLSSEAVSPDGKRSEALGIVKQGLDDISISRTSISWGVTVPWDPEHVFYVWYDALINYATAVGFGTDEAEFEAWWPNVHHVIGKDILRFHCVYWPAMLLAAGLEPPKKVHVHGFLLLGGKKLSKSGLTQISPSQLTADFGVDGYRYHFLRDLAFGPDSDFSYEAMVARYNTDLANNLGNLLARVVTVVQKKCDGIAPAPDPASTLAEVATSAYADAAQAWDRFQPSVALDATWRLMREANAHLEKHEPWKLEAGSPEVKAVLGDALEVLRITAILASPALTRASEKLWQAIGLDGSPTDQRLPEAAVWGGYPGGATLERGAPLFPRLEVEVEADTDANAAVEAS